MVDKELNQWIVARANEDIREMIDWILREHRDRFDSESHLVRCAIIFYYNKLKGEQEIEIKRLTRN